ncbi:hypothetical protein Tco_0656970, partial [Tanacetum coccineum]
RDHDEYQGDDATLEGKKSGKRKKISKSSESARGSSSKQPDPVIDEDEVIPEDETLEILEEFQNVDKRVLTIFDRERMKGTLRDMLSNQFRDAEEHAYHLEQSQNYMENQIRNLNEPPRYLYNKDLFFLKYGNTEENRYVLSLHKIRVVSFPEEDLDEKLIRWDVQDYYRKVKDNPEELFFDHRIVEVVRVTTEQQHGLDYMDQIVMRENDKTNSFSEANFKYLNKNDIEDMYYLCLNKKVNYHENKLLNFLMTFNRSCVIWERVHDFQLGIESYQLKINLTAPTLIFLGIEECDPFSIVDKPTIGLIYLNSKNEKRFMDLKELSKFCDATLEKVLNEVKLKIFKTEFLKKAPLLGSLDLVILKAYERETKKRLSHREQIGRWESFLNGRPILQMMRHQ